MNHRMHVALAWRLLQAAEVCPVETVTSELHELLPLLYSCDKSRAHEYRADLTARWVAAIFEGMRASYLETFAEFEARNPDLFNGSFPPP